MAGGGISSRAFFKALDHSRILKNVRILQLINFPVSGRILFEIGGARAGFF